MVRRPIRPWLALGAGLVFAGSAAAALEIDDYASAAAAYQRGDLAEAWRIWQPLARDGDVDAQFSLGMLCAREPPIQGCDAATAVSWYTRAAEAGHRLAQFSLGTALREGRGVARDDAKARYWFEKAAAQGLPAAHDALLPADSADLGLARGDAGGAMADDGADPASAAAHAPRTEPQPLPRTIAPAASAEELPSAAETRWLAAQDPARYTAQLAASPDATGLRAFADRHALGETAHVLCARGTCYLVYGAYAAREDAWSAIATLPEAVRAGKPWPRAFSYYQSRSL